MRQEAVIGLAILVAAFGWLALIGITDWLFRKTLKTWKEWNA